MSPPEEALPLSRVLPFSQQWAADDAERTIRLDSTTGVLAAAGDEKEGEQNEMVRATPVGSFSVVDMNFTLNAFPGATQFLAV